MIVVCPCWFIPVLLLLLPVLLPLLKGKLPTRQPALPPIVFIGVGVTLREEEHGDNDCDWLWPLPDGGGGIGGIDSGGWAMGRIVVVVPVDETEEDVLENAV